MESLTGRVHFNIGDGRTVDCSTTEERRYIRVNYDVSLQTLAEFMASNWDLGLPDIMISMISGVHQSKAWKKPEHSTKLQKGIVKLTNTSQTWIFTHGLNYGLAKLIGDAVREDQDRRSVRGNWDLMSLSAFNQRIIHPRLIGVVPDALLNNSDQYRHGPGRVEIHTEETERPTTKYEMNSSHNVFVLVNNTSYATTAVFRGELERALQKEGSARKDATRAAMSHSAKMEDESPEPPSSAVMEYYDPVTYSIPLICILIQGGPAEIDQVLYYLNDNIPVMVIKGTGLMADLLAFAYEEIMERGGIDIEMQHLKPEIENKMSRYFPGYFKDNESERKAYLEKILKCVEISHKYDRKYITIFDLALSDSDLADLDWFILKALFACQPQYAINQRKAIRKNLLLTVMWNRPDLARSEIFQRDFSIANLKIDPDIFEQALLLRDREEFVDLFLEQNFPLSSFVTATQLKTLFAKAEDREFFITVVWEGILEKSPATPMRDKFVYVKMNAIIEYLTGLKNFVKISDLAQGSQGQLIIDYPTAERQAINALIVWSVLMNRTELVKVLWKFCEQPIPMALFISSLYKNLSHYCPTSEMEKRALENGKLFGTMAVDVLHLSYQDTTNRAFEILAEPFVDFEHMTPMEISYRVGNKHFIAHPCSQRYLNEVFNGGIRVVKSQSAFATPDFVKIILSALLIVPMYLWIAFPRLEAKARDAKEKRRRLTIFTLSRHNHLASMMACPMPMDEVRVGGDVVDFVSKASGLTDYSHVSTVHIPSLGGGMMEGSEIPLQYNPRDSAREEPDWTDSRGFRYILWKLFGNSRKKLSGTMNTDVTVTQKLFCIWNAPVTKFWMYQLNYWCYLILLSYITFVHGCGDRTMDWVLWIWTLLNLVEYICRTHFEYARRRLISVKGRIFEMFLILNFLIIFLFSRIVDVGLPIDRYSTRILLCAALLFFYYRLVFLFFPISRKLGPMLEKIKLMVSVDFMVFLKMVMPFMVASAIAMQAAIFPDYPLGWDSFRMTFYRAFFSLFLTPSSDLQLEAFGKCAGQRMWNDSQRPDQCWAGTHTVADCPVVGVSSYLIVIQYAIVLKMILVTLLAAMFYNTYSGVDREADSIWKFQRYQMVLDFSTRSALPAPFSLISYFIQFTLMCCGFVNHTMQRALKRKTSDLPPIVVRKADFFKYWKTMVKEYCRNVDMAAKEEKMAKDHFKKTLGIEEELNRHRSNWYRLRERIIALEQNVQDIRQLVSKAPESETVTTPPSTMRFSRRDLFRRQL